MGQDFDSEEVLRLKDEIANKRNKIDGLEDTIRVMKTQMTQLSIKLEDQRATTRYLESLLPKHLQVVIYYCVCKMVMGRRASIVAFIWLRSRIGRGFKSIWEKIKLWKRNKKGGQIRLL